MAPIAKKDLTALETKLFKEVVKLTNEIRGFSTRLEKMEKLHPDGMRAPKVSASINTSEVLTTGESSTSKGLSFEQKVTSAKNANKILPPNLMVDGRHTVENIGAICGFEITHELEDAIFGGE